MNLLKSLANTQTQRAQQPIPGQAANLQKMLGAKSGKAGAISGPAISNIGEQQALKDFSQQATVQQQAAQVDTTAQQLANQTQQQQQQQAMQRIGTQRQQAEQQYEQNVQKISNNLDRFKGDLKSKEGKQALAEALFTRRLADKDYITNLQRQGQISRLEDAQAFELEAGKAAFGRTKEIFRNDAEFAAMLEMEDNEFRKEIANMSEAAAMAIVQNNIEAMNTQAQYSAMGSFGSGLIAAGSTEYKTTDKFGSETEASFFDRIGSDKPLMSSDGTATSITKPETIV